MPNDRRAPLAPVQGGRAVTPIRNRLPWVLGAALLLQFVGLSHDSLWLDELFSIWGSSTDTLAEVIERLRPDVHPPLYQTLLWVWMRALGDSETATRLLSACAGALAVAVLFFGTRRLYGQRCAWFASTMFAACYTTLLYGRTVRSYELLLLLSTIFTIAWLGLGRTLDRGDGGRTGLGVADATAYALSAVLVSATHFYGALLVGVGSLYLLGLCLRPASRGLRLRTWILVSATGIASLAVLLGWLSMSVGMKAKVSGHFWIEPPNLIFAVKLGRMFAGTVAGGFAIYPLIAWSAWRVRAGQAPAASASESGTDALLPCVFLMSGCLGIAVASSYIVPTVTDRNMIIVLPAFWLGFMALVLRAYTADTATRLLTMVAAGSLGLSVVRLVAGTLHPSLVENDQPREAVAFVRDRLGGTLPVCVIGNDPGGEGAFDYWDYYLRRSDLKIADVRLGGPVAQLESTAREAQARGRGVAILIGFLRNVEQQQYLSLEKTFAGPDCEVWKGHSTIALACKPKP